MAGIWGKNFGSGDNSGPFTTPIAKVNCTRVENGVSSINVIADWGEATCDATKRGRCSCLSKARLRNLGCVNLCQYNNTSESIRESCSMTLQH